MNRISKQFVFIIILLSAITNISYAWSLLPCLGDCLEGKSTQLLLSEDVLSEYKWAEPGNTIGNCESCDACEDYYHSSSNSLLILASSLHPSDCSLINSSYYTQLLGRQPDPYRSPPA